MLLLLLILPACLPQSVSTPSLSNSPSPLPLLPTSPTPLPSASPTASPSHSPTPLPLLSSSPTPPLASPTPTLALFPLTLPISNPLTATIPIDPSYRFASTQGGLREPHHGIEFLFPFGSPVLAAADGTVLFAGNDNNGGPYSPPQNFAFYGNFIILEHDLSNYQLPTPHFYTLYAHLSQLAVETGDTVRAGDEIGLIGFTGAALGPHLHFEVRLNALAYADAYNPELFLNQPGRGVLIGRILDAGGFPIPPTALTLTPLDPVGRSLFLTTYEDPALALRPPFNENFALALPSGQYELAFVLYGIHKQLVEIHAGEITYFDMTVGNE